MREIPIDRVLTSELESEVKFGGGTVEGGGFFAQIADKPIALRLRTIFLELGQSISLGLYERFEVWLIPHRVAIIRRRGFAEAVTVGVEVAYEGEGRTCSIVSLIPSPEFIKLGEIRAGMRVTGKISASGEINCLTGASDVGIPALSKGGLDFGAASDIGINFQCKAVVSTPIISAVGIGSARCEWRFDKAEEPLFGRDIETWSVLVLSKHQRKITYKMRFYFIMRTLFVPTRRESDWVEVNCDLST